MQGNDNLCTVNRKLNLLLLLVLGNILFVLALIARHEFSVFSSTPTIVRSQMESPHLNALDRLRYKYGRKIYSHFDEESLIRSFFKDIRGGFFVDVGASDC